MLLLKQIFRLTKKSINNNVYCVVKIRGFADWIPQEKETHTGQVI